MGIPVLIIGKSGSGKSASLRNFKSGEIGVINVIGKPLPFRGGEELKPYTTDEYQTIIGVLKVAKAKSIVIDDAGYLMTNMFMRGHSSTGSGNAIFSFYNDIGDRFWQLVRVISEQLPADRIVYMMMHEDKNDFGDIKPKTIGKMLDEKVCVEGMFSIVLRSLVQDGKHIFCTKTNGFDVAKTPIGMFENDEIDNDLCLVDAAIRGYYNLSEGEIV